MFFFAFVVQRDTAGFLEGELWIIAFDPESLTSNNI